MTKPLLEQAPFSLGQTEKAAKLLAELNTEFNRHYGACAPFRRICEQSGWCPEPPAARLDALPILPVQYFKEAGEALVSVPADAVYVSLYSSATSGRPSTVMLDHETAKRQARAVASVLGDFLGKKRRAFLIADLEPQASDSRTVAARAVAMRGFLTFARTTAYALADDQARGMVPDQGALDSFMTEVAADGRPVCLAGFTFLLYTALLEPLERVGRSLPLPEGSAILHLGGWKKLEERRVSHDRLAEAAAKVFGVAADKIIDIYGFTEQIGTIYPQCPAGRKHAPVFADVIVRDARSFAVLPDGEVGIGQFLSLVPRSYPGFSVLTDDLVRVLGREACPCGRKGTTFEVLGREKTAEIRGCGDVLAEAILSADRRPDGGGESAGGGDGEPVQLVFAEGIAHRRFDAPSATLPLPPDWDALETALREAQRPLAEMRTDDILGIFAAAGETWADRDGPFAPYHTQGLSFIVNYLRRGRLQAQADEALRGRRTVLDGFAQAHDDEPMLRALPRGLVVHWLAGNVPTLGMLSLMMALVTKNANIVKLPSGDSPLLPEMLHTIGEVSYRSPGGRNVRGRAVADAVAAVYFPPGHPAGAELSSRADARIAWGGAEAVGAVMALPRRHDVSDIVFGPKFSHAAVGREALSDERQVKRLARSIATDLSVFDQQACASAQTVFVERGGAVAPKHFAALLAEAMEAALARIPPGRLPAAVANGIKSARMRHFLDGRVFAPAGLEWSVLFRDSPVPDQPVYGRTAYVRVVDDLMELGERLDRGVQAIGLALAGARRATVAERLAKAGVARITLPGQMTDFTLPWDGVFPLERLIRWVSLR